MTRELADLLMFRFTQVGLDAQAQQELRDVLDRAVEEHEELRRQRPFVGGGALGRWPAPAGSDLHELSLLEQRLAGARRN